MSSRGFRLARSQRRLDRWHALLRLCIIASLHQKLGDPLRTHKNANAYFCQTGEFFMTPSNHCACKLSLLVVSVVLFFSPSAFAQSTTTLPSESPAQVKPVTDSFDYTR